MSASPLLRCVWSRTFWVFMVLSSALGADNSTFLVITNATNGSCVDSGDTLTNYTETRGGFPGDVSRCSKDSSESRFLEYPSDEDGGCHDQLYDLLDFCQAAFGNDTATTASAYCLSSQQQVMEPNIDVSNSSFCEPLRTIREEYFNFESILDRTLVGVYARTCENKTMCLKAYARWLCSISLPWYTPELNSSCIAKDNNDTKMGVDNMKYARVKPWIGRCHEVLRRCPYYLPSEQQLDENPTVLIYGGYPAFDCPRDNRVYSSHDCFGNSSVGVHGGNIAILALLLVFLCLTVVRKIH